MYQINKCRDPHTLSSSLSLRQPSFSLSLSLSYYSTWYQSTKARLLLPFLALLSPAGALALVDPDDYGSARNRHARLADRSNDPGIRLINVDNRPDHPANRSRLDNRDVKPARPDRHEELQPRQTHRPELPHVGDADDVDAEAGRPLGHRKRRNATHGDEQRRLDG